MPTIDIKTLENELRSLVAEITEVEAEKVTSEARFIEDLGMDSMMALEVLASIEKKYKLKIPEDYLMKVTTLASLIEITNKFLEEQHNGST